jgi:hypothetical protein
MVLEVGEEDICIEQAQDRMVQLQVPRYCKAGYLRGYWYVSPLRNCQVVKANVAKMIGPRGDRS